MHGKRETERNNGGLEIDKTFIFNDELIRK